MQIKAISAKEFFESLNTVYCIKGDERIEKYNKESLFDIDGTRFSDGWGGSWNYIDLNKTWSGDATVLYSKLYDEKRIEAHKYQLITKIYYSHLNAKTKHLAIDALLNGFKATLYGEKYKQDSDLINLDITKIDCIWTDDNDEPVGFCYVWGFPGPDMSIYYFKDFNKSWFLKDKAV